MRRPTGWPATLLPSVLAALTTWVALWAWSGFLASPSRLLEPAVLLVVLVGASGVALRSLRVPALLVPLGQVVVLASWLTHRWAPETAWFGWVPTSSSVGAVTEVVRAGVTAAQTYTAPVDDAVPEIVPLLLLAAAAVALLVDFLACTLRRVPAAGLPLLAVYTAPASILLGGVPWWAFAAGATSFLALIAVDHGHRLVQWGRHVPREPDTRSSGVRAASTRRSAPTIALAATALAVLAPVAVPTMTNSLVLGPGSGIGGDGDSVSITNPMVDLRRDLVRGENVELVRVSTDGDPSYLRVSVLDDFDGDSWRPSPREIPVENQVQGPMPRPPGLDRSTARTEQEWTLEGTGEFDSMWLPTPYPASTVEVSGDWRYDERTLDVVATDGQTTAGLDYSLTALELAPTAEVLLSSGPAPESVFTPNTDLPEDMPPFVAELARELTDGLGTRFEKAVRLQRWFREDGGFTYSLEREAGNGTDDLMSFLGTGEGSRVGYCEQFAASMALMGRTLGIPSRVAVGFLRPERLSPGEYVYRAHDLHAWPEMYFDGAGWVRFEPTPQARAAGVPGYTTESVDEREPTAAPSAPAPSADPQQTPGQQRDFDTDAAAGSGGGTGPGTWVLLAGALAVVLLGAPRTARTLVRRRRWAGATSPAAAAEAGWAELRDAALDLRLGWDESVTLRTRAAALATELGAPGSGDFESHDRSRSRGRAAAPEAAAALDRLVRDVERARFAPTSAQDGGRPREQVRDDVRRCGESLRDGASRSRRRRATWLPMSLVRNGWWRRVLVERTAARRTNGDVVGDAVLDHAR